MTTEAATTLATYLADIGTVFTALTGWVGDVISLIMTNPVLLVGTVIGFAFTAVHLFKALR